MSVPVGDAAVPVGRSPGGVLAGGRGAALIVLLGAAAAFALSLPVPEASGARRALSPATLLAAFDAVWLLALVWPRAGDGRSRTTAVVLLAAVGAPFHLTLASTGGAQLGHAAACLIVLGGGALAGAVAGRRRLYVPLLALALLALPLIGYGVTDFTGVDALWMVGASPLTALVAMARAPVEVAARDGLAPGAALLAAALLAFTPAGRHSATATSLLPLLVGLALLVCAGPASAADDVTVYFDGVVRSGRPVTVRVAGASRVRAEGGPWALPVGERDSEFILHGVTLAGETLRVEAEIGGELRTHDVDVRPADDDGPLVARLGPGPAGSGEALVRAVDLPTVREAWLVFDGVDSVPPALPSPQRAALAAFAESGVRPFPFEPALLPAGPHAYRATAAAAERAPYLPSSTARVLVVLAALELLLLALAWRGAGKGRPNELVAALVMPIVALAWLLVGDALPGPVRATAIVLDGETDSLVLLRLTRSSPAVVSVEPPPGAGMLVPLRWDAGGTAPAVSGAGRRAEIDLRESTIALLAYRVPGRVDAEAPGPDGKVSWIEPVRAWIERHGLQARQGADGDDAALPRIEGVPVFLAGRASIRRR